MKKKVLPLAILLLTFCKVHSQVGINTTSPAATLDITAKNATGTSTSVDGVLITRLDRQRAQSMTGVPASTLIYVNSVATGSQTGTAVNIDTVGYYYYNGSAWVKLHNPTNSATGNIYNTDGTLTGNRTVSQGSNTLAFTGTQPNAFSVNGSTFSVDAANSRVGVGTVSPANKFVVKGFNAQPSALGLEPTNATLRVDGDSNHAMDFGTYLNAPYGTYISSQNKTSATGLPLVLNPVGGNVGVNTTPKTALDVNGAITNRETVVSVSGNAASVPSNVSQIQLTGSATGTVTITAPAAPNAGQRLIVFNNTTGGFGATLGGVTVPNGKALEFVYSNSSWVSTEGGLLGAAPVNIYNTDGTLTGNRTVSQGSNTLAFTGTQPNAFSVNGSTFSVDAANGLVGVGTTTPSTKLTISTPDSNFGLSHTNGTISLRTYIGGGAGFVGTSTANDLKLMTNNTAKMVVTSGGTVGVNVSSPSAVLDIMSNGATNATKALEINDNTNKELLQVADDGSVRLEKYKNIGVLGTDANGFLVDGSALNIPAISTIGFSNASADQSANSEYTVTFSINKNNAANITYSNGLFTINKAGYYNFSVYVRYDISMNSSTGGTAITRLYKNSSFFTYSITGHGDGTLDVGHNLSGTRFFNVGDVVKVGTVYTRTFKITDGSISIVYYGT
ncbi:beta strand repeat-containing protein [Chryseobacterium indologenes]|uniref:beta strand repeat-containing protein n=1 Tax=Chryseobacterium indologenes TaxID=253 RepID=UPI0009A18237|nr:hypothetical protein [Chryseobacterium indologenes]